MMNGTEWDCSKFLKKTSFQLQKRLEIKLAHGIFPKDQHYLVRAASDPSIKFQ